MCWFGAEYHFNSDIQKHDHFQYCVHLRILIKNARKVEIIIKRSMNYWSDKKMVALVWLLYVISTYFEVRQSIECNHIKLQIMIFEAMFLISSTRNTIVTYFLSSFSRPLLIFSAQHTAVLYTQNNNNKTSDASCKWPYNCEVNTEQCSRNAMQYQLRRYQIHPLCFFTYISANCILRYADAGHRAVMFYQWPERKKIERFYF